MVDIVDIDFIFVPGVNAAKTVRKLLCVDKKILKDLEHSRRNIALAFGDGPVEDISLFNFAGVRTSVDRLLYMM